MRIDAHHHLWDLGVRDQPWTAQLPALRRSFDMDDLRPSLTAAGIDGTIVVQSVATEIETRELLAVAATDPAVMGVVGWVDLVASDVGSRINSLRSRPCGDFLVGIRHSARDEPDPRWLYRAEVRRGLAAVADSGLTYELLIRPEQLPTAIELVRALPQLRFVLDHAAQPRISEGQIEPWRTNIAELASAPNVAVKLSSLVTQTASWCGDAAELQPYADTLLSVFGSSRVLFGSDWPVCLLAADYTEVVSTAQRLLAALSNEEAHRVFGSNAATWYELPSALGDTAALS